MVAKYFVMSTQRLMSGLMPGVIPGDRFFSTFPFWFPLLFFAPFLSQLLLTNQAPMIIKGGTGIVFILSLISEDNLLYQVSLCIYLRTL